MAKMLQEYNENYKEPITFNSPSLYASLQDDHKVAQLFDFLIRQWRSVYDKHGSLTNWAYNKIWN